MADFQAHINQAKKNLYILSETSLKIDNSWDWQVTMAYYVAVHLMNAHLAITLNLHYKTHKDVKIALFNDKLPCKVDDSIYTAYVSLELLSRRSRYLCHETPNMDNVIEFKTFDRHLKKALKNLDVLIDYFSKMYAIQFDKTAIDCIEIKAVQLQNFYYKQSMKVA